MTDIWDEKPVSDYPTVSKYEIEMDAWLEKLKAYYEPIEARSEKWIDHLVEVSRVPESAYAALDKLEDIKNHLTKWSGQHSDWQMGLMSEWKKELVNILEDEG